MSLHCVLKHQNAIHHKGNDYKYSFVISDLITIKSRSYVAVGVPHAKDPVKKTHSGLLSLLSIKLFRTLHGVFVILFFMLL